MLPLSQQQEFLTSKTGLIAAGLLFASQMAFAAIGPAGTAGLMNAGADQDVSKPGMQQQVRKRGGRQPGIPGGTRPGGAGRGSRPADAPRDGSKRRPRG